ncbi:MAG: hypothetical protein AB1473_20140 [Thermodesulfobacteriota bacterium]
MKYVILVALLLLALAVVQEFVLRDRSSEGLKGYGAKLKDLGRRLHVIFGVLALFLAALLAVRLLLKYLEFF